MKQSSVNQGNADGSRQVGTGSVVKVVLPTVIPVMHVPLANDSPDDAMRCDLGRLIGEICNRDTNPSATCLSTRCYELVGDVSSLLRYFKRSRRANEGSLGALSPLSR